ncbi:hypothetical protein ACFSE0_07595 [Ochrobactrum teleogrylli]|uniref:Uncharacterized protein n=1 Tax=Ochrobactrum teleogrylli TaxID=2479765 RepID=A0ABY2Y1Q7_9HYPH|nr:hypothetical protein [[Ochrobactrum] teleogrylli]TNV13252.1 hypothetical protein FIC94_16080 [[Ochrobactrum] teleogrylli]
MADTAKEKKADGKCRKVPRTVEGGAVAKPAAVDPSKTAIFHYDKTGTLTVHQERAEQAFGSSDPNFIVGIANQLSAILMGRLAPHSGQVTRRSRLI